MVSEVPNPEPYLAQGVTTVSVGFYRGFFKALHLAVLRNCV